MRRQKQSNQNRNQSGQGITEYGAILGFVALLISLVLSIGPGQLRTAISGAFSSVSQQLDSLSSGS